MNRLLICIFLICSSTVFSQYDVDSVATDTTEKESGINWLEQKERIYVGGDFSFSFGGDALYLMIQPLAGYELWKGISAGPTLMYQLNRVNIFGTVYSYHAYGGGVFARYRPERFPFLLAQTEFDLYNTEDFSSPVVGERTTIPAWYLGLGYAGGFGNAYYHLTLFWDVINNESNPLPQFFSLPSVGPLPLYIRYGIVFYLE